MSELDDTVGFIGLGVMGGPMAGHLVAKGFKTTVYNRSPEKIALWSAKHQGRVGTSPAAIAKTSKFVISCVGNDDDLRAVAMGSDGAIAEMSAGSVYIDHSTTSYLVVLEL